LVASFVFSDARNIRQTQSMGNFDPMTYMNKLPFSNGGPFVPQSSAGQKSTSGLTMNGGMSQLNVNQTVNGTQGGIQPLNSQPATGQQSAAGFTSSGQSGANLNIPGSGINSGQMSSSGFSSGQPIPGSSFSGSSLSGSGSGPTSGFSGSNMNPFQIQTQNGSKSTSGFSGISQFNPNIFGTNGGQQPAGSFNPNQMLGRSMY
jgi:hypothetical protein